MKKEKSRTIIDIVGDINSLVTSNKSLLPESDQQSLNSLFEESNQLFIKKKKEEKAANLLSFFILIAVSMVFVYVIFLMNNIDYLSDDNSKKENLIQSLKESDSILSKLNIKDSLNTISAKEIKYKSDEVFDKFIDTQNKLTDAVQRLDMVKSQYGIKFREYSAIEKGKRVQYLEIVAPKLDSALMLYPYFKDKLKYNENKKSWWIDKK